MWFHYKNSSECTEKHGVKYLLQCYGITCWLFRKCIYHKSFLFVVATQEDRWLNMHFLKAKRYKMKLTWRIHARSNENSKDCQAHFKHNVKNAMITWIWNRNLTPCTTMLYMQAVQKWRNQSMYALVDMMSLKPSCLIEGKQWQHLICVKTALKST